MPPAISDQESVSDDEIPAKAPKNSKFEAEEEESEDEDGDPDEYIVEKIISHAFERDGSIKYEVKWQGYDDPADRTWEPEENLTAAQESLADYFKLKGGRPIPEPPKKKGRKRKSLAETPGSTPRGGGGGGGRGRKKQKGSETPDNTSNGDGDWPKGTWEHEVMNIETVEELPDPETGKKERYAYLAWNSGKKSQHPLKVVNQKCPQKMLQYYEQHLVFKSGDDPVDEDGY